MKKISNILIGTTIVGSILWFVANRKKTNSIVYGPPDQNNQGNQGGSNTYVNPIIGMNASSNSTNTMVPLTGAINSVLYQRFLPENLPGGNEGRQFVKDNYPGGYIKWIRDYYDKIPNAPQPANGDYLYIEYDDVTKQPWPTNPQNIAEAYVQYYGAYHGIPLFGGTHWWFERVWGTLKKPFGIDTVQLKIADRDYKFKWTNQKEVWILGKGEPMLIVLGKIKPLGDSGNFSQKFYIENINRIIT